MIIERVIFMTKPITCRAFTIKNNNPKLQEDNSLFNKLSQALIDKKTIIDRTVISSHQDEYSEREFISYVEATDDDIFGTIMKVKSNNIANFIPDQLFEQTSIKPSDLDQYNKKSEYNWENKGFYYFFINKNYFITNISRPAGAKKFQIYINALLKPELYDFSPLLSRQIIAKIKDVKEIVFGNNVNLYQKITNNSSINRDTLSPKIFDVAKDLLYNFIGDVAGLESIDMENYLSAQLLVRLKNPRKLSEKAIYDQLSAVFKPIGDSDEISIKLKDKTRINGSECEKTKCINIETTEDGYLNDNQVRQEMAIFIKEIESEEASI